MNLSTLTFYEFVYQVLRGIEFFDIISILSGTVLLILNIHCIFIAKSKHRAVQLLAWSALPFLSAAISSMGSVMNYLGALAFYPINAEEEIFYLFAIFLPPFLAILLGGSCVLLSLISVAKTYQAK